MQQTTAVFQLPTKLDIEVRKAAAERQWSRSKAIRQALELWLSAATCPACDRPTVVRDGIHYCISCNMPVKMAGAE